MRGRPAVAVVAALVVLLAGCSSEPGADAPMDDLAGPSPFAAIPDLPCGPDRSGTGMSPSLTSLAFETFGGDGLFREEIDTAVIGGRTILAISQPGPDSLEFFDATDPTAPRPIANWTADVVDFTDDFKFLPDATGIVLVGQTLRILDVRDLDDIQVETTFELAGDAVGDGYGHTVAAWELDGRTYVSIGKAEAGDVSIFAVDGPPGQRTLSRTAHIGATPISALPGRPDTLRSHDTWFEVDPADGKPLLWVANVNWGIIAYDVSDPSDPLVAATMLPSVDNPMTGYMHTAQVTHLDGRRLVVGVQEYETGVLKVWDATDLAAPKYIGYWHSPVATMPFHNMQVVGPYVFATHFHDGLYVFDLAELPTTDGLATMMEVFAHAPAEGRFEDPRIPVSPGQSYDGTLEVVLQDGILWTTEGSTGMRSLAFGCLTAGDPAATSTG